MKIKRLFNAVFLLILYLGIHNGHLAVFRNNKVTKIFPYSIHTLPPAAQEELKEGIPYSTNEELAKLLQTYLS